MTLQKHRFGNFKPPKGYAREKRTNSQTYKDRPGMSPAHLVCIRKLRCCVCGARPPVEAHHLKQGTNARGMGLRSPDKFAVPLCPYCHGEVERAGSKNEQKWFEGRGLDALLLADALYRSTGELDRLQKIVLAHMAGKDRP